MGLLCPLLSAQNSLKGRDGQKQGPVLALLRPAEGAAVAEVKRWEREGSWVVGLAWKSNGVDYPVAVSRSPRAAPLNSYGQAAPEGGALLGERAELVPPNCPKPAGLCTEDLSPQPPLLPYASSAPPQKSGSQLLHWPHSRIPVF